VTDECIHGFQGGLCASCFPKPAPEPVVAVAAPRRSAAVRASAARTARVSSSARALDSIAEQRIYHVTHVRNLASILAAGQLIADKNLAEDARPTVDISSPDARDARRTITMSGSTDATVSSFVPFFLSPNARLWQSIRSNEADPRLSRDILDADAADFVILVSTVRQAMGPAESSVDVAVTDDDAAGDFTRIATTRGDAERMLRRLRVDEDEELPAMGRAELLVRDTFPLTQVSLVGVAHDKARAAVKEILAGARFSAKVAVYPPWFASE
jgi:hypothetical protein